MHRELDRYRDGLVAYIEATYHISHPTAVEIRRRLLTRPRQVAQEPYVEATPRYEPGRRYADLTAVPAPVRELLSWLATPEGGRLVFDPPYHHQAEALEQTLGPEHMDLLVTTGTGSGKTETFLLPLLGRLFEEAAARPASFRDRGLRALVLYPMNALVNDQLGRLRLLFGAPQVCARFQDVAGRPPKFSRYTGRTLYPGLRTKARNQRRLEPLRFYLKKLNEAAGNGPEAEQARALVGALQRRGKWPAKPDLERWFGRPGQRWEDAHGSFLRAVELPEDAELMVRHEVHDQVPDLLMTNYSMLEYTLLRPLERPIWSQAARFFAQHPEERLVLVLDEAHLYRGAAGTEVAMLIRRLRERLELPAERLQVICTSASFSDQASARRFVAGLTGKDPDGFFVPEGRISRHVPSGAGIATHAEVLAAVDVGKLHADSMLTRAREAAPVLRLGPGPLSTAPLEVHSEGGAAGRATIWGLTAEGQIEALEVEVTELHHRRWAAVIDAAWCGVPPTGSVQIGLAGAPATLALGSEGVTVLADPLPSLLYNVLKQLPVAGRLVNLCSGAELFDPEKRGEGPAQALATLGDRLFLGWSTSEARRAAADALVELAGMARVADGVPLLAARVHAFFRGLPGLWGCVNQECSELPDELHGGPVPAAARAVSMWRACVRAAHVPRVRCRVRQRVQPRAAPPQRAVAQRWRWIR